MAEKHFSDCTRSGLYRDVVEVGCADERKRMLEGHYKYALRKYAKNSRVAGMVKDYYAFWLTSMTEIDPRTGEATGEWKRRIETRLSALRERGSRLQLEGD